MVDEDVIEAARHTMAQNGLDMLSGGKAPRLTLLIGETANEQRARLRLSDGVGDAGYEQVRDDGGE